MMGNKDVARLAGIFLCLWLCLGSLPQVHAGVLVRQDVEDGFLAVRAATTGKRRGPKVFELQPGDWISGSAGVNQSATMTKFYGYFGRDARREFEVATLSKFVEPDTAFELTWDIRSGAHVTLYAEADCWAKGHKCQAVAWPGREAQARILDSALAWRRTRGTEDWSLIYKIQFAYPTHRICKTLSEDPQCAGWVDSRFLRFVPKVAAAGVAVAKALPAEKASPPAEKPNSLAVSGKSDFEALHHEIGQCVIEPKRRKSVKFKPKAKNETAFDAYLAPHWKKKDVLPEVYNERGERATRADLVAIDAMARTLYAEMAECYDNDPRYLAAVGRVILNRAESAEKRNVEGIFMQPEDYELHLDSDPRSNLKHPITRVVTKPWQFSAWNPKAYIKRGPASRPRELPNPSLSHVLCPPAPSNKVYWRGDEPGDLEREIWDYVSYLAIKAVLFPNSYKKEDAPGLEAHYFTSGVNMKRPFKRLYPRMGDFQFPNGRCMKFWTAKGL